MSLSDQNLKMGFVLTSGNKDRPRRSLKIEKQSSTPLKSRDREHIVGPLPS